MSHLRSTTTSLALSILCVVAAASCTAPAAPAPAPMPAAPAAEAPAAPTQVVEVEKQVEMVVTTAPGGAHWDAIRQSGELKVGVSAGDSPYAFYNADLTLDGFDVALAREIARRLNLEIVIRDLAQDALPAALQSGQVDLAIGSGEIASGAAVGPCYLARDAVLTRSGGAPARTAADLIGRQLGVLKGSGYEAWANVALVASGQMDPVRLVHYASALEAADALAGGEVDALLLDYRPALRLAQERGLSVAGEGLAPRQELVTAPAGSEVLRAAVAGALGAAVSDGTVAGLAGRYFGLAPQDVLPLPVALGATPTPRPPGYFSADRPRVSPGGCAVVSWHIENVQAVFFSEAGQPWERHPATGQEARQVCPARTTTYELHVVHYDGREEARSLTVTVSSTPEPPAGVLFEALPARVGAGGCVELHWEAPADVGRVRITRDGVALWDDVTPSSVLSDCPPTTGVALYRMEAGLGDGATVIERPVEVAE